MGSGKTYSYDANSNRTGLNDAFSHNGLGQRARRPTARASKSAEDTMKVIVSLTVLLVLLTGPASQAKPHRTGHHNKTGHHKPNKLGTAYFIEFEAETFVAVTVENINTSADKIAIDPDDLATLRDILSHHQQTEPAEFDKYKVRVRIQDEKRNLVAVVDQQGVVIENGRRFGLTPLAFVELYSYLKYILNGKKA